MRRRNVTGVYMLIGYPGLFLMVCKHRACDWRARNAPEGWRPDEISLVAALKHNIRRR